MVLKKVLDVVKLDVLWEKNKNHYKKKLGCFQMEEIPYFLKQIYYGPKQFKNSLFHSFSMFMCRGVLNKSLDIWLTDLNLYEETKFGPFEFPECKPLYNCETLRPSCLICLYFIFQQKGFIMSLASLEIFFKAFKAF